jgi:NAD(P)-dependent dehydrogenase (short-subunit alcohol dehydrogenase family)
MVDTDSLAGQTVVVIGGTKNIGLAIARRAANTGATVVIAGRDPASAAAAAADLPAATGIALDLDDEASIAAAAASIPVIDHVVITAAAHHNAAVTELNKDKIFGAFQAKVVGPLLVAKHFSPKMSAGGSMVLFSGVVAWRPSAPYSVMAITNGAVQFTASALAKELAPIRVNAVSPGIIDSGAWDKMPAEQRQSFFAQSAQGTLAGRVGDLADIADAVIWLLSASFVSGETIHVEGGARHA